MLIMGCIAAHIPAQQSKHAAADGKQRRQLRRMLKTAQQQLCGGDGDPSSAAAALLQRIQETARRIEPMLSGDAAALACRRFGLLQAEDVPVPSLIRLLHDLPVNMALAVPWEMQQILDDPYFDDADKQRPWSRIETPPDGNCLFWCFSTVLGAMWSIQALRSMVAERIGTEQMSIWKLLHCSTRDYPPESEVSLEFGFMRGVQTLDDLQRIIRSAGPHPRFWGEGTTLGFLCEIFQLAAFVLDSRTKRSMWLNRCEAPKMQLGCIVLLYDGRHYDCLVSCSDRDWGFGLYWKPERLDGGDAAGRL